MGSLVAWGYWGLFIGSFLASTIIPMSAGSLIGRGTFLGREYMDLFDNCHYRKLVGRLDLLLAGMAWTLGLARALVKSEARAIGETEGKD